MARLLVHHGITWLVGGEFCEKMKFVVFEMWGLERLTNFPKWSPLNSWYMKVLSSEGFSHGKLVGAPRHNLIGWWGVFWKNEIHDFWDVRVGKAYKCPQMNTMKFLVHESLEFRGFVTWPSWSVQSGIAIWLGGVLWKNEILGFWDVRVEKACKYPQMNTMKFLVHESFEFEGFAHGKLVGAPRHNLIGWWGVLWKNEIRGFWDVRVGKAYKFPQMKTIKFLVHESFEFGGVCTWQAWRCTTA